MFLPLFIIIYIFILFRIYEYTKLHITKSIYIIILNIQILKLASQIHLYLFIYYL